MHHVLSLRIRSRMNISHWTVIVSVSACISSSLNGVTQKAPFICVTINSPHIFIAIESACWIQGIGNGVRHRQSETTSNDPDDWWQWGYVLGLLIVRSRKVVRCVRQSRSLVIVYQFVSCRIITTTNRFGHSSRITFRRRIAPQRLTQVNQ